MIETSPYADLIAACHAYCQRAGIKPTTFGRLAVNDGKFLARLEGGGRCWPETEARVRRYMRANPVEKVSA